MTRRVITKDSGNRDEFATGARRDTQEDKPRFDMIHLRVLDYFQSQHSGVSMWETFDDSAPPIVDALPTLDPAHVPTIQHPTYRPKHPDYRPDLIPDLMINRLAHLYGRGARKYSDNNWQKGIPLTRVYASLFRHLIMWAMGDTQEDHLAAIIWNATTLMWTEREVAHGELPEGLADMGPVRGRGTIEK